jgi:hypothetical protein
MRKGGRKSNWHRLARIRRLGQQREAEAENRRKLLGKLSPEVRALAIGEFAKLGLWEEQR